MSKVKLEEDYIEINSVQYRYPQAPQSRAMVSVCKSLYLRDSKVTVINKTVKINYNNGRVECFGFVVNNSTILAFIEAVKVLSNTTIKLPTNPIVFSYDTHELTILSGDEMEVYSIIDGYTVIIELLIVIGFDIMNVGVPLPSDASTVVEEVTEEPEVEEVAEVANEVEDTEEVTEEIEETETSETQEDEDFELVSEDDEPVEESESETTNDVESVEDESEEVTEESTEEEPELDFEETEETEEE